MAHPFVTAKWRANQWQNQSNAERHEFMKSKLHAGVIIVCFYFVVSAPAQLDSSALRAKYGSPLNRETFHMSQGFDLIVDYGMSGQACRLEVPSLMPSNETVSRAPELKQRMVDFLSDLVPNSMRGKELGRSFSAAGAASVASVEYENVVISDLSIAGQPFAKTSMTVVFKNCRNP